MTFKSIRHINESTQSEVIQKSLQHYIDSSFLGISGYYNIQRPTSGQYGSYHKLYPLQDSQNKKWGSNLQNWVWEQQGIQISGVWINGALLTSGYSINYRDGYIQFDTAKSGTIELNFSAKYIDVIRSEENDFLRGDADSFKEGRMISGAAPYNRSNLPTVAIHNPVNAYTEGYEIGSSARYCTQDIIIDVLSKNESEASKISDILHNQVDKTIKLFDYNKTVRSGVYPYSKDGFVLNKSGTYEYMTENFPWNGAKHSEMIIKESELESVSRLENNVYHGVVRLTVESVLNLF